MSTRPGIFISAVSKELGSARQSVANCLISLGYTPDWQDIFSTSSGEVLALLRGKVDKSSAVVQLVGKCYGAEPAEPTSDFGRVSYTQYEALYARSKGKPVYYITLGEFFPPDPHEPEPEELRQLQENYHASIRTTNALRHKAAGPTELENTVLRLRDDLARLRRRTLQWAVAVTIGIGLIACGVVWLVWKNQKQEQTIGKLDANQDALLAALRDYTSALSQTARSGGDGSESSREAAVLRYLEGKHGLPLGTLEKEFPAFAAQVLLRKDTTAFDKASALLIQKKYPEAEAAGIAAKDEALRLAPTVATRAIQGLEAAGWAADAQFHYPRALDHFKAAAALTDVKRDALEWARVQEEVACLLDALGRTEEAEPVLQEVIAVRERALGPEHLDTLGAHNDHAEALRVLGRNEEAEAEHRAVIKLSMSAHGPEHLITLGSRSNLSIALSAQGRHQEAEDELRAVLEIQQRVQGPGHPDTLSNKSNLAMALKFLNKGAESETLLREVLEARLRLLGPDHPDTIGTHFGLALALWKQDKREDAMAEAQIAAAGCQKILGESHPLTAKSKRLVELFTKQMQRK